MRVMNWVLGILGFYVLVSGLGLIELGVTVPDMLVGFGVSVFGLALLCVPVFVRSE